MAMAQRRSRGRRGRGRRTGRGYGGNSNYNNTNENGLNINNNSENKNSDPFAQINDDEARQHQIDPNERNFRIRNVKKDAKYDAVKHDEQKMIDKIVDENQNHMLSVKDKLNMRTILNQRTHDPNYSMALKGWRQ